MQSQKKCFIAMLLMLSFFVEPAFSRDAARDLSKMIGYTIISASTVKKTLTDETMKKYVICDDGQIFQVDFLILDPLPLTDIIVFAKPFPKELREKYKDLPPEMLLTYKVMIDNECYDATPKKL